MFEWNLEVVAIENRPGASLTILKWVRDSMREVYHLANRTLLLNLTLIVGAIILGCLDRTAVACALVGGL